MREHALALHLFDARMRTESRFLKLSATLVSEGLVGRVVVYGLWMPGLRFSEDIDAARRILRQQLLVYRPIVARLRRFVPAAGKLAAAVSILERQMGILWQCLRLRPRLVVCHNPETLPAARLGAAVTGATLVYAPHELESERAGVRYGGLIRAVERFGLAGASLCVCVSPPIRDWYAKTYGFSPVVAVRNVPINPRSHGNQFAPVDLRARFGVPPGALLFIYQGLIDGYRSVDDILRVFEGQQRHHIVFMGFGDAVEMVKAAERRCPRIHFMPPVPMHEIVAHSAGADVGLMLAPEPCSLSYRLTTANKVFEYAIAGVPVLISENFEYMSQLVRDGALGWTIAATRSALAARVESLESEDVEMVRGAVRQFGGKVDWDIEVAPLVRELRAILQPGVPSGRDTAETGVTL